MPFDAFRLIIDSRIIEGQGVERSRALRLALVPEIIDAPLTQSVLISTGIGRAQAPAVAAAPTAESVEVPGVLKKNFETAEADLKALGLRAFRREALTTTKANDGVVFNQDPEAGDIVRQGTTVVLFIGKLKVEVEETEVVESGPS